MEFARLTELETALSEIRRLEYNEAAFKTEIARLQGALDSIDDHGRALAAFEMLKEKDAEIAKLNAELEGWTRLAHKLERELTAIKHHDTPQ